MESISSGTRDSNTPDDVGAQQRLGDKFWASNPKP